MFISEKAPIPAHVVIADDHSARCESMAAPEFADRTPTPDEAIEYLRQRKRITATGDPLQAAADSPLNWRFHQLIELLTEARGLFDEIADEGHGSHCLCDYCSVASNSISEDAYGLSWAIEFMMLGCLEGLVFPVRQQADSPQTVVGA